MFHASCFPARIQVRQPVVLFSGVLMFFQVVQDRLLKCTFVRLLVRYRRYFPRPLLRSCVVADVVIYIHDVFTCYYLQYSPIGIVANFVLVRIGSRRVRKLRTILWHRCILS